MLKENKMSTSKNDKVRIFTRRGKELPEPVDGTVTGCSWEQSGFAGSRKMIIDVRKEGGGYAHIYEGDQYTVIGRG